MLGTVAVAAGRGSAVTTGVAVRADADGEDSAVWLGLAPAKVGSSWLGGDFAQPMATLKVSATPITTAKKKSGVSERNRRKRKST